MRDGNERERMLSRIRQAVIDGNQGGTTPPLTERGTVAYQGAGPDPVERFCRELRNAGSFPHVVPDVATARLTVIERLQAINAKRALLGSGAIIDALDLEKALMTIGCHCDRIDNYNRETWFAADVGISEVDYLIAETGSLVCKTAPRHPRSVSLLPPVHLVVAHRRQIIPDLFDLFVPGQAPPACQTLITGPSKTGDIELKLVTGVHGPGEVHVILLNPAGEA